MNVDTILRRVCLRAVRSIEPAVMPNHHALLRTAVRYEAIRKCTFADEHTLNALLDLISACRSDDQQAASRRGHAPS
jgi:hypothetical protein